MEIRDLPGQVGERAREGTTRILATKEPAQCLNTKDPEEEPIKISLGLLDSKQTQNYSMTVQHITSSPLAVAEGIRSCTGEPLWL